MESAPGRKFLLAITFLALSLALSCPTFAQGKTPAAVKEFLLQATLEGERQAFWDWPTIQDARILGEATPPSQFIGKPSGFLPNHPLYFLKTILENFQVALTTDPVKKEEKRLQITSERIAEVNYLAQQNQVESFPTLLNSYKNQVSSINPDILGKNQVLAQKLEEALACHHLVLIEVVEKVPEAAKPGVENAIEASQKGMDTASDAQGKPPIPTELKTRIEALKTQGFLSLEETTSIIGANTRNQARETIFNLVNDGKIPEADALLLDEKVKEIAPQIFEKLREEKKLEELNTLLQKFQGEEERLEKLKNFLKTQKPGETIPESLKQYLSLQRVEELKNTLRPQLLVEKKMAGTEFLGPGGCYNKESCNNYCSDPAHRQECLEFLSKAPEEIRQQAGAPVDYQKYLELMKRLGCTDEATCRAKCEQNPQACKDFAPPGGIPQVGPGGCKSRQECEQYCSDPAHEEECEKFTPPYGGGRRTGPGGCETRKECEAFCQNPANREECSRYGGGPPGGGPPAGQPPTGPGGCKSAEECEKYCQDPAHRADCLTLWQEHGFPPGIAEHEEKAHQEGRRTPEEQAEHCQENPSAPDCAQPRFGPPGGERQQGPPPGEWSGPGGCRSDEECGRWCAEHQDDPACKLGPGGSSPQVQGYFTQNKGPGNCQGVFFCWYYCLSPLNWPECRGF